MLTSVSVPRVVDTERLLGSRPHAVLTSGLPVAWVLPGKVTPFGTTSRVSAERLWTLAGDGLTFDAALAVTSDVAERAVLLVFIHAGWGNTPMRDAGVGRPVVREFQPRFREFQPRPYNQNRGRGRELSGARRAA